MSTPSEAVDSPRKLLALIAGAVQVAMGFLVAALGLLVPLWAVGVLILAWVASTVWAFRTWRRHRFAAPIPVAAMIVFWVAFPNLGDVYLDGFGA